MPCPLKNSNTNASFIPESNQKLKRPHSSPDTSEYFDTDAEYQHPTYSPVLKPPIKKAKQNVMSLDDKMNNILARFDPDYNVSMDDDGNLIPQLCGTPPRKVNRKVPVRNEEVD